MIQIVLIVGFIAIVLLLLHVQKKERVHRRLIQSVDQTDQLNETPLVFNEPARGLIASWLYRAGYRSPIAAPVFIVASIACALLAILFVIAVFRYGVIDQASDALYDIPGGVGNVMVPFANALPWLLVVIITLIPTLLVRSARRRRVDSIQQDLPLLLDLLNTLSQAGIGFDSALDRILGAQSPRRPLVQDLRAFQRDTLAGRSRLESLGRCMKRVEVPMFSAFMTAMIQAEQTGGGLAATLRTQAAEMRSRRRERATAIAMAVPTKLVLPMVVGFLPGIFVILLGPMITAAFGVLSQQLRSVTGQ